MKLAILTTLLVLALTCAGYVALANDSTDAAPVTATRLDVRETAGGRWLPGRVRVFSAKKDATSATTIDYELAGFGRGSTATLGRTSDELDISDIARRER